MKYIYLLIAISIGSLLGLEVYTFIYADGISYFSESPQTCVNCHVMRGQYESWSKSGHHHVATCNDCHLAHDGINKWISKARNGFHHSMAFTLGNFHEPISITKYNSDLLNENCKRCHETLVHDVKPETCTQCHRNVGHYPRF